MAEQSGFFASVGGDRRYGDDFIAQMIAAIIGNGVYNGELALTASGDGMNLTHPIGRAWINGRHYFNDAPMTFTVDPADGVLNRKDTFVLRWDINARNITAQLLKGTPASSPTAPAIVRSAEQFDLKTAEISIPAGTTTITQSLITNYRPDESVCGFVAGVVQQLDTATLYQQLTNSFDTWFNAVKGQLSTDAAGNLQNEIDKIVSGTTKTGKTGYADTSGNVSQQMDIIDGGFQVNSIGASKNALHTGSGYPVFDVWKWAAVDTNAGIGQYTDTTGVIPGSKFFARLGWAAALSTTVNAYQLRSFIENGVSTLCGYSQLTFSFWARGSADGQKLVVGLSQYYGTGGSPSTTDIQQQTISLTTSWKKYFVTFPPISISAKTFGSNNDDYLMLAFMIDGSKNAQTSGNIDITQVQLDIGPFALPYRNKSLDYELIRCMRFYQQSYSYGTSPGKANYSPGSVMFFYCSANYVSGYVGLHVEMQILPNLTFYDPVYGNPGKVNHWGGSTQYDVSVNSFSQNCIASLYNSSGAFTSAVRFHWVADARY